MFNFLILVLLKMKVSYYIVLQALKTEFKNSKDYKNLGTIK